MLFMNLRAVQFTGADKTAHNLNLVCYDFILSCLKLRKESECKRWCHSAERLLTFKDNLHVSTPVNERLLLLYF